MVVKIRPGRLVRPRLRRYASQVPFATVLPVASVLVRARAVRKVPETGFQGVGRDAVIFM